MDVLEIYKNSIGVKEEFFTKEKCKELLYKSKDGDIDARNELVENFLLFVINRVTRFKKIYVLPNMNKIPLEDLIQDINLFVLETIDKWEPCRGCFTTAMTIWIDRQLLGIFNDRYFTGYNAIRVPTRTREQCGELEKIDPNCSFSPKMISNYFKVKLYRGLELFNARKCIKIYRSDPGYVENAAIYNFRNSTSVKENFKLKEFENSPNLNCVDIDIDKQFKYLPLKTRQMIEMRYGINSCEKEYSYEEIGKKFNLNRLTVKNRILAAIYNFRNSTSREDW